MTQFSMLWDTERGVGDGANSYTEEQSLLFFREFSSLAEGDGVIIIDGDELSVSGTSSPLSVEAGDAYVYGHRYMSTATESPTVTTPAVGLTGGRIIIKADWVAKTVRIATLLSADGTATLPSLTQTAGTAWEIALANFYIDTGGNIWKDSGASVAGVADARLVAISPLAGETLLRRFYSDVPSITSVDFEGIPDTFENLVIRMALKLGNTVTLSDTVRIQANGLGSPNYDLYIYGGEDGNSIAGTLSAGATYLWEDDAPGGGASSVRDATIGEIILFGYNRSPAGGDAVFTPYLVRWGNSRDSNFTNNLSYQEALGYILTSNAIESLSFDVVSNYFIEGSVIELWGIR